MTAHNPSDLTKAHYCYLATPAANTTYDFAVDDLIDMEPFEYVLVTLVVAAGTWESGLTLTASENATNAATGEVAIPGAVLTVTDATEGLHQMEIRTHGLERYLQLDLAIGATASAPAPVAVIVHGVGFKASAEATDEFPTSTAVALQGGAGLA